MSCQTPGDSFRILVHKLSFPGGDFFRCPGRSSILSILLHAEEQEGRIEHGGTGESLIELQGFRITGKHPGDVSAEIHLPEHESRPSKKQNQNQQISLPAPDAGAGKGPENSAQGYRHFLCLHETQPVGPFCALYGPACQVSGGRASFSTVFSKVRIVEFPSAS